MIQWFEAYGGSLFIGAFLFGAFQITITWLFGFLLQPRRLVIKS